MIMRSAPEMSSFLQYCERNPELRFWQALVAWVAEAYKGSSPYAIDLLYDGYSRDTFFWEWEGEHPIGPGRHDV